MLAGNTVELHLINNTISHDNYIDSVIEFALAVVQCW